MDETMMLTGQAIIDAIRREASAGRINSSSASSCRTPVRKVLEASFGQAWDCTPFPPQDGDRLFATFESKYAMKLTPGSLSSYKSNFQRALTIARRDQRLPPPAVREPEQRDDTSTSVVGVTATTRGLDPIAASSSMENLLELAVLSEIVQEAWFGRGQLVDVMHSSVDAFGHDVVLECGPVLRHVQFKARRMDGTTSIYKINTRLAERPSGCVVWIGWQQRSDANRVDLEYRWFGGEPGEPLPDLGNVVAKHSKANAEGIKLERPDIRVVNLGRFERLPDAAALVARLFGSA